jgi:L-ascorbate metabolism protein UlaG (beta-lactamase superfamily)
MNPLSRLTFLGHSTVLIEIAGVRILTDPVLFDRIGPLRRTVTSLDPDLYRRIDLALVSHLHLDHFDVPSLRLLGPALRIVVPAGAGRLLDRLDFANVDELGAGEGIVSGAVRVTATHAAHGGFRPPFGPNAAAVGYLVEAGDARIYFAGDTDLFPGMADLAPDLDVALLPVWGWGPNLGRGHLDPGRAAQALRLLRPRYAVPIHWGTLWPLGFGRVRPGRLSDPPIEFAALAAVAHPDGTVLVTPPGRPVTFTVGPTLGEGQRLGQTPGS